MTESWFSQWFIDLGTFLSVAGFALTVYVTSAIYKIRNRYARKGRVPIIQEKLQGAASGLSDFLVNSGNDQPLDPLGTRERLAALAPPILDAVRYSSGETRKHGKRLQKLINEYVGNGVLAEAPSRDSAWTIYQDAMMMISLLDSAKLDDDWNA